MQETRSEPWFPSANPQQSGHTATGNKEPTAKQQRTHRSDGIAAVTNRTQI